jgi:Domain of unknown function (DUF222)
MGMGGVAEFADEIILNPAEFLDALAAHEQQAAVLALAARRLDASGEWAADGSVSIAAWLRANGRMSNRDANRLVRRGRFLDRFTAVADAAVSRELSSGQLDALQGSYRSKHEPVLVEQQHELVETLKVLSVSDTETACRVWAGYADAVVDEGEPPMEADRSWTMSRGDDGALVGRFVFDDAAATEMEKAVANALTFEGKDDTRDMARRQGDAMFDVCAFFNKNHHSTSNGDGTRRHLPHVTLSADATTLAGDPIGVNDDTGRVIDTGCTDTYLCDCKIHVIVRDADGQPEAFGRSVYTVPRKLFRQVAARDGGCRMPGCDRKVRHCDAHHIKYWRHQGLTDYWNLTLLCSRHHHMVHRQWLDLKLLPNGELHVTWPDGTERVSQPRGAPPKPWPK